MGGRWPWPRPGRAALPGEKGLEGALGAVQSDPRGLALAEALRVSAPTPRTRALGSRRVGHPKHRKSLDHVVKNVDDGDTSHGDGSLKGLPVANWGNLKIKLNDDNIVKCQIIAVFVERPSRLPHR